MKDKRKDMLGLVYNEPAIQVCKKIWAPLDFVRMHYMVDVVGLADIPTHVFRQIHKSRATTP